MMIQQALFVEEFEKLAPALDKIKVDVNLNETFLVQETKRIAEEILNQSRVK